MLLSPGIPEAREEHWALPVFRRGGIEGSQGKDELGAQGIPGLKSQGISRRWRLGSGYPEVLLEFLQIPVEMNRIRSGGQFPTIPWLDPGWN